MLNSDYKTLSKLCFNFMLGLLFVRSSCDVYKYRADES